MLVDYVLEFIVQSLLGITPSSNVSPKGKSAIKSDTKASLVANSILCSYRTRCFCLSLCEAVEAHLNTKYTP